MSLVLRMMVFSLSAVGVVFLGASAALGQGWTEDFASGVGHLDQTVGAGDTVFVWNAVTESIDGTFDRSNQTDRRYALLGPPMSVDNWDAGFTATVTPTAATGGTAGIFAGARIGFFDSGAPTRSTCSAWSFGR